MTTNTVIKEIYIEEDHEKFVTDFSPMYGKYSCLFNRRFIFRGESSETFRKLLPTSLRENNKDKLFRLAQIPKENSSDPSQMMSLELFY